MAACPSGGTIVQRAHGVGSATFPHPTTAGNMIVIGSIYGYEQDNPLAATDDSGGNLYQTDGLPRYAPDFSSTTLFQYVVVSGTCSSGILPASTITAHELSGIPAYVWVWEINGTVENICTQDWNQGNDANPVGSGLFLDPSCALNGCPTEGDCFVCLTLCGCSGGGGTVTSVDTPWTLEPIQGGNAAAYLIEQNLSATDTVQYHMAGTSEWVVSENAYEAIFIPAGGSNCGCMTSQIVGNPLIKGPAKCISSN